MNTESLTPRKHKRSGQAGNWILNRRVFCAAGLSGAHFGWQMLRPSAAVSAGANLCSTTPGWWRGVFIRCPGFCAAVSCHD